METSQIIFSFFITFCFHAPSYMLLSLYQASKVKVLAYWQLQRDSICTFISIHLVSELGLLTAERIKIKGLWTTKKDFSLSICPTLEGLDPTAPTKGFTRARCSLHYTFLGFQITYPFAKQKSWNWQRKYSTIFVFVFFGFLIKTDLWEEKAKLNTFSEKPQGNS